MQMLPPADATTRTPRAWCGLTGPRGCPGVVGCVPQLADVLGTPGGCPSPQAELGTAAGRWHAAVPGMQARKAQLTRRRGRGDFMPYPSIPLACQGQCFVPRFNRISSCSPAALIRSGGEGSLGRQRAGGCGDGARRASPPCGVTSASGDTETPLCLGCPAGHGAGVRDDHFMLLPQLSWAASSNLLRPDRRHPPPFPSASLGTWDSSSCTLISPIFSSFSLPYRH